MPDSDEDYERRNRDKFVRERDYGDRNRGRDFNADRNRRDYSNGVGMKRLPSRREDEVVPVAKRNRFDSASDSFEPQFIRKDDAESAPVLLTFKKFLSTQDTESLTDEEAIAKYVEYKINFKKQECEKYFQEHKDEEWFRLKYHPEESKAYKETQQNYVKKRLEVFNEFLQNGLISKTSLDFVNAADIIRLMDSVVIKLEGGSDEMIKELNDEEVEDESVAEVAKLKAGLESAANKESNSTTSETTTADSSKPDISTTSNGKADENSNGKSIEDLVKKEPTEENAKKKKLHKTCSIHFKTIPANAKFFDLENICKQHPGLLRVGLTDPLPEAKLNRYGWVTYRRDVNIKEIFWSLKNAKLNGTDLGAVVNRDLKRRVRQVSGITVHRTVAQNDIRQAAKLIALYDHRAKLFVEEDAPHTPLEDLEKAIIDSKNPILDGAVDYLVEEASAEEDVLLGLSSSLNGSAAAAGDASNHAAQDARYALETDKELLNVLDKYILYLRIVHSVDYYNCGEYVNEDSMPNRVGLIHVRGMPPSKSDPFVTTNNSTILLSKKFVDEFISSLNERLSSTLLKQATLNEEELEKLGKKDADKAVEEFVEQNCVELSKEKWLCPLSGKKFKGPEFIHKHLQSKHSDKLNEVRDEVLYFNNYLNDPHRPRNPDPPKPPPSANSASNLLQATNPHSYASASSSEIDRPPQSFDNRMGGGFRGSWNSGNRFGGGGRGGGYMGGGGFNNRSRYFDPPVGGGGSQGGGPPGGGMDNGARRDPRQPIAYRDLDAPEEIF